jgi:hypothetical protein
MRRNLHARLEHLEQCIRAAAGCHCMTVVWDGHLAPPSCPHGRRWSMVVHVVYDDAPESSAAIFGDWPPTDIHECG